MKALKSLLLSVLMVAVVFSFSFVAPFDTDFEAHAATSGSYRLDDKTITVYVGESITQKLYNSSDKAVTATKITWKSSNKKIAKISEKGKITGVKAGETKMTAKYKGKTYKFTVKVKSSALKLSKSKITFNDKTTSATVKISSKAKYTTEGYYFEIISGKENVDVSWSGNWKDLGNGRWEHRIVIKMKQPGEAKIKVYPEEYPKKSRTITVKYDRGYKTCYEADMYKVGTDIPAGEYVVFANNNGLGAFSGYVCISSDANQNNIIENENFGYNTIVSVRNGDYLEISRGYAVPIKDAKVDITRGDCMLKVGYHIAAGDYRLMKDDSGFSGYYAILNGPVGYDRGELGRFDNIVANENFDGSRAYITVENGQYVTLTRCSGNFVEPEVKIELEEALDYTTSLPDGTTFDVAIPDTPIKIDEKNAVGYLNATVYEIEVQKLYDKKTKTYAAYCGVYGTLKSNQSLGSITLTLLDAAGNEVDTWSDFYMNNGSSSVSMSIDAHLDVEKLKEGKYTLTVDIH